MKYDITPEDLQIMERDLRNDRTLKHLKNLTFYKFSIGDVLIREERYRKHNSVTTEYEWKVKLADCGIPNKYVYVFENELNIGYIRRLSINGRKFVERATCVTEFDPDQTRFLLDPEYADHMLLADGEADFDAKSRYDEIKKKREQIHRKNKKLRLKLETCMDVHEWLKTLKIGDQIWYGYDISRLNKDTYFIHEINISSDPDKSSVSVGLNAPNAGVTLGYNYRRNLITHNLINMSIFTSRPIFVDEIIN